MAIQRYLALAVGLVQARGADNTHEAATTDAIGVGERTTSFDPVTGVGGDTLDCNLGRMPVLTTGGVSVGQSGAVNYYIAATHGFLGDGSPLEGALVMQTMEHLRELKDAFRKCMPYGTEPTKEGLETFFDTPAGDVAGVADGAPRFLRHFVTPQLRCSHPQHWQEQKR